MNEDRSDELTRPVTKQECSLLNQQTRGSIVELTKKVTEIQNTVGQIDIAVRGKREGDNPGLNQRVSQNEQVIAHFVENKIAERMDKQAEEIKNLQADVFPWKQIIVGVIIACLVGLSLFLISIITGSIELKVPTEFQMEQSTVKSSTR